MKGFMYILECANGSYYTGSKKDIEMRLLQHQNGEGANHTKKHLPVKLVYFEEFDRIDSAFYREKQVQGWSRKKKEALINGAFGNLPDLSMAYRDKVSSRASDTTRASDTKPVVEALETTTNKASRTSAYEKPRTSALKKPGTTITKNKKKL